MAMTAAVKDELSRVPVSRMSARKAELATEYGVEINKWMKIRVRRRWKNNPFRAAMTRQKIHIGV